MNMLKSKINQMPKIKHLGELQNNVNRNSVTHPFYHLKMMLVGLILFLAIIFINSVSAINETNQTINLTEEIIKIFASCNLTNLTINQSDILELLPKEGKTFEEIIGIPNWILYLILGIFSIWILMAITWILLILDRGIRR